MKRDQVYLSHMLDAIKQIEIYTKSGENVFSQEKHWQDATIRQLEIIGEATKRISKDIQQAYPDVPWRRIAGLRDVLIHEYMGVDLKAIWEITQKNLPQLRTQLETILKNIS
ncbi:MAG: DUF86 domain-containing protein [Verrucomicrobia bacterium]|nr:DUF86 domain-containing protein [Verrucomicrobiota bacterium]MBS0636490.1 DUF86 domain-containing protein [Verrucomicrobiota bacterium]